MELDLRTILVTGILIGGLMAAATFAVYLKGKKGQPYSALWPASFGCWVLSYLLLALRGRIPDFASIVLGNAVGIAGLSAAAFAAADMAGSRRPRALAVASPVLAAAAMAAFLYGMPSMTARVVSVSLLILPLCAVSALKLLKPPDPSKAEALRSGGIAFVFLFVVYLARSAAAAFLRRDISFFSSPAWDSWSYLLATVAFAGLGYSYVRMADRLARLDLEQAGKDTSLLLREMRHRTKNNLALISSLVSLQADQARDPVAREGLSALKDRIRAVAAAYRLLSAEEAGRFADAREYLGAVAEGLRDGIAADRGIEFSLEVDEARLDTSQLVPLGIVVNELATNAAKHAFPDGRGGVIAIRFSRDGEGYRLSVEDDGIGMDRAAAKGKDGLGLTLVEALSAQLRGRFAFAERAGGGTAFELSFKAEA